MKKLSKPVLTRIIVYALLVLALLVVAQFLNSYFLQIIIYIFMFAYFASAWNILSGFAGQFSLGHAIFIGVALTPRRSFMCSMASRPGSACLPAVFSLPFWA